MNYRNNENVYFSEIKQTKRTVYDTLGICKVKFYCGTQLCCRTLNSTKFVD